jgi:predicted ester cyclase
VVIGGKGTDESAIGPDGLKALCEEYCAAFPGFEHEIDEMVAEGDLVGVFMTSTGTHEGEFRGVRPTGNEFAIEDNGLLRIRRGEIVDVRPLSDMLGLFEQIGVGSNR